MVLTQLPQHRPSGATLPKLQRVITPPFSCTSFPSSIPCLPSCCSRQDDSLWIPLPGSALAPGLRRYRLCRCKFFLCFSRDRLPRPSKGRRAQLTDWIGNPHRTPRRSPRLRPPASMLRRKPLSRPLRSSASSSSTVTRPRR